LEDSKSILLPLNSEANPKYSEALKPDVRHVRKPELGLHAMDATVPRIVCEDCSPPFVPSTVHMRI